MKFSEVGLVFLLGLIIGIIISSLKLEPLGLRTTKHKKAFFLGIFFFLQKLLHSELTLSLINDRRSDKI
jgi:multisubunit Na+/H+ antiporter MnhE subunit